MRKLEEVLIKEETFWGRNHAIHGLKKVIETQKKSIIQQEHEEKKIE